MKLEMIDHIWRGYLIETLTWGFILVLLILSIDTRMALIVAEGQLEVLAEQGPPPPPGDTIVVLAGKVLGIGCFQIIPFTPDWDGG